jgi:hypothetical protein
MNEQPRRIVATPNLSGKAQFVMQEYMLSFAPPRVVKNVTLKEIEALRLDARNLQGCLLKKDEITELQRRVDNVGNI